MTAGLSLAERNELRERYRRRAIAQAEALGMTQRCRYADDFGSDATTQHARCRGEAPGGAGCLCRCHDAAAATIVVSKRDEKIS